MNGYLKNSQGTTSFGLPQGGELKASDFELVRLAESDLPSSLRLERSCYSQPWTYENFEGEFHRQITVPIGLKREDEVAAHCYFWIIAPEVHLLNLAVAPLFRRLGLARRLLSAMVTIGCRAGAHTFFLEVRSTNHGAIALYEAYGFKVTGQRPGYYEDGEDAHLMTLEL